MERASVEIPFADGLKGLVKRLMFGVTPDGLGVDPYAFVITSNIKRRHLKCRAEAETG